VRKTSRNVKDAINRISFREQPNRVHLKDYNEVYWEISNAPESAVYGAALIGIGLAAIAVGGRRLMSRKGRFPIALSDKSNAVCS